MTVRHLAVPSYTVPAEGGGGGPIVYIGTSTMVDGGNDRGEAGCQPAWPAAYTPTAGHYAVMFACYSDDTNNSTPATTPSGWTQLAIIDDVIGYNGNAGGIQVFGRVLAGGDTLAYLTATSAVSCSAAIIVYSGVSTTTPMDATPVTSSTTSAAWQPTGITTVTNGADVLSLFFNVQWTHSPVASGYNANGFTLLYSEVMRVASAAARISRATAGAQSMPTWASDTDGVCHIAVALRPG